MDERAVLLEGARLLGVALSEDQAARLQRLLDELERWNRAYNLTSITDRAGMVTHHLLDSLSMHPLLHGETIADVGTGAGFPGLPLAIVNPERRFTLIDSNNKKVRFVGHAARTLGLTNVEPVHSRVETLRPAAPFDSIIARAFAALPDMLTKMAPLCGPDTRVLAMKGKRPDDEIRDVPPGWRLIEVRSLSVPGLEGERHAVIVGPAPDSRL